MSLWTHQKVLGTGFTKQSVAFGTELRYSPVYNTIRVSVHNCLQSACCFTRLYFFVSSQDDPVNFPSSSELERYYLNNSQGVLDITTSGGHFRMNFSGNTVSHRFMTFKV